MTPYTLGQPVTPLGRPVTFTQYLRRRSGDTPRPYSYRKFWEPTPVTRLGIETPATGVLIGVRTLSNGTCSFGEDGTNYQPENDSHFTAWLIAYDLRRNPVLVLPEHTTTLTTEG